MGDNFPVNVLAQRYATEAMREIWSQKGKILAERNLWIAVMKAQSKFGYEIPSEVIDSYEKQIAVIDLASIDNREKSLRHDVKARIEEFNSLAGFEAIHIGMTSRDLTENIEALQVRNSLLLVRNKATAVLAGLRKKATEYKSLPIAGRTHNVPAQVTTLGKRFASVAEEMLIGFERLENLITRYPIRGIKGAVGTAQDSVDLIGIGSHSKLERYIANYLGFEAILDSTGQVYPRSMDFEVLTTLVQLASPLSSLATSIRLMAGAGLVTEGFKKDQVGSSAMPHKMNTRSCERVNGLTVVLKGFTSMVCEISGNQWNEGDVSCSVVRRVAIPDGFYAIDGIIETILTILSEFEVFPEVVKNEIAQSLPFLATSKILMAAVKKGLGREFAHSLIKEHSMKAAVDIRTGLTNSLLENLAQDYRFPLNLDELKVLIANPMEFTGDAIGQISRVIDRIDRVIAKNPQAALYHPNLIR